MQHVLSPDDSRRYLFAMFGLRFEQIEIRDAIKVDGEAVRGHLNELVRSTVEQTLNSLLDAEADQLCGAKRYERSADHVDPPAGSYKRQLETEALRFTLGISRSRRRPELPQR